VHDLALSLLPPMLSLAAALMFAPATTGAALASSGRGGVGVGGGGGGGGGGDGYAISATTAAYCVNEASAAPATTFSAVDASCAHPQTAHTLALLGGCLARDMLTGMQETVG